MYINERFEGIHVIDNRDPSSPQNVAFLDIPGNIDLAVNGDALYADSYVDLVTIDISNPKKSERKIQGRSFISIQDESI